MINAIQKEIVMNYDEMSDFEVNSKVANAVGFNYATYKGALGVGCVPDYCNSASEAWSIIVENKIGLMHTWHKKGVWSAVAPVSSSDYDCNHDNPLRAAMICFLKMQESK